MPSIISLAAAGAFLLSFASAETFDVRSQLLHNKFGDLSHLTPQVVRRQDDRFNATDETLNSITSAYSASRTASSASAASTGTASSPSSSPYWTGPDALYIINMCMPNLIDVDRATRLGINLRVKTESQALLEVAKLGISLGGSPFPCEQSVYIDLACHANATKPADYLAEQQCYCGSTFVEANQACNSCFLAHGLLGPSDKEYGDFMTSFSAKVCDATPMAGGIAAAAKTDLPDQTTVLNFAPKTAVAHPSSTAVSLYATLPPLSMPAFTGEATARATNWGNWPTSAASAYTAPVMGVVFSAVALGAALVL